ncbi:MAG: hypothetical protein KGL39_24175 [Patescibacteria group bacterium]|nr:hypothetical protein [Patescibacteria group bacterium]
MTRVSKDYADYERGTAVRHCALCRHFWSPDKCAIVTGEISPKAVCRYFEKKKDEK